MIIKVGGLEPLGPIGVYAYVDNDVVFAILCDTERCFVYCRGAWRRYIYNVADYRCSADGDDGERVRSSNSAGKSANLKSRDDANNYRRRAREARP